MKCPKCSFTPVPEKARFCPNCGARLALGGQTVEIPEATDSADIGMQLDELEPDKKPKSRKKEVND